MCLPEKTVKSEKKEKPEAEELQAFASVNPYQQTFYDLNYPNAMSTFASFTIPTTQIEMIKKAKELREYDIVDYFLRLRCDYGLPIQAVKCARPRQQDFYNKNVLPLLKDFARQFEYEFWSNAEIFPHYGFKSDDKTPMYLVAEDPESINPISALGVETYEIKISTTLKKQLQKLKEQNSLDTLPSYLRNAIKENGQVKDKIVLDKTNMTRVCNQKADYALRPRPILLRIGKSLILREFLIDVDYVNGFSSQKSNFTHIKCGDKDTHKLWDDGKIKKIHDLVTLRAPGDVVITTRYDVDIKPINMNLSELFDAKKFEECNKRILNFFGISAAFMPSESGGINNSTVVVTLKGFEESVKSDRKAFKKFTDVYFAEINRKNGFSEIPEVIYETTNIRDSKEFREELEFFCGKGVYGYEDLCVVLNLDKDDQVKKREWDWKNRDTIAPTYEESQGLQPLLNDAVKQKIKIGKETKPDVIKKPKENAGDNSG